MTTDSNDRSPLAGSTWPIIDAQVHVYEPNHPGRPWTGRLPGPDSMTGDQMISAMDSAGVDKALIVSSWAFYDGDASYAAEVFRAHSERFRIIAPVNPYLDGAVEAVTAWGETPGSVGIRLMPTVIDGFDPADPRVRAVVRAAEAEGFPICVYCPGRLDFLRDLASLYPDTRFVLDHLGLAQPFAPPPPPEPFAEIGTVLDLARFDNVFVKVSGAATLSHRPFPFDDLWEPLQRYFDAFGIQRCLWGTDWTRAVELVSYPDAVTAFKEHLPLSSHEKAELMGGVLAKLFRW
ncbi:MAG: amidohydrolase family protein [Mycobacteriaceae bacterium]